MSSSEDLKGDVSHLLIMNGLQPCLGLPSPEILLLLMIKDVSNITACNVVITETQIINQQRTSPALNRMDPKQHDELISEISNLVQRRLVITTTLSEESWNFTSRYKNILVCKCAYMYVKGFCFVCRKEQTGSVLDREWIENSLWMEYILYD